MIDCYSKKHALSSNIAGVGMARKIGLDYCLMFAEGKKRERREEGWRSFSWFGMFRGGL